MTRTRITTDGITDATVTTAKIVDAAVTTAKLADSNVTTAKIADSAITSAKLAADSVITVDIANGNVTYAKIQNVSATDRLLGRSSAGAGVVEEIICTAQGRALIDDATAADQRTTLGLGTMATQATTSYLAVAGGTMTGQLASTAGSAAAPGLAVSGDTNTGLAQIGGADTLGVVTGGVERWRVGSDGSAQSVIPGGSTLLPQFQCRAWVTFDGTRDTTGAASTANTNRLIRASGNVTSVLRNALGDYTITFTTAMPDANYCVTGTCGTGAANGTPTAMRPAAAAAGTLRLTTVFANATAFGVFEADFGYVAIFR
jgi:hypothetical protein